MPRRTTRLSRFIDGDAEITIGGNAVHANEGDMVVMPANVPHALQAIRPFQDAFDNDSRLECANTNYEALLMTNETKGAPYTGEETPESQELIDKVRTSKSRSSKRLIRNAHRRGRRRTSKTRRIHLR